MNLPSIEKIGGIFLVVKRTDVCYNLISPLKIQSPFNAFYLNFRELLKLLSSDMEQLETLQFK